MATFTITVTAAQALRIATAFGKVYGLVDNAVPPQPRAATAAEVQAFLLANYVVPIVMQAESSVTPAPF